MEHLSLGTPLFIAAGLKIGYDVALYMAFRRVRVLRDDSVWGPKK
jgi:hypothetical protein